MTPQEALNIIYQHAASGASRCVAEAGLDPEACLYRNERGNRCFIGKLIPDDLYKSEMEGLDAYSLAGYYPELPFANLPSPFLSDLQALHDQDENWNRDGSFKMSALRKVANRYGLEMPQCD